MFLTKIKTMASCLAALCFLIAGLTLGWSNLGTAEAHARQAAAQDRNKPLSPDREKPADKQDKKQDPTKTDDPTRDGGKKEEKKDVGAAITRVHLKSGKAIIRQTGKESHEAQGNPLFVQRAKAEVKNGTLHLEGLPGVEFDVEVKDLSELTVEGIGTVEVKDLKTKRLEVTVKVNGQALVSGTAEEQVINVSGVGRFNGEECKGKQGKVQVDAAGSAVVNVSDKLQVKIQGVGRVNYLGTPNVEKDVAFGGHLAQGAPANVGGFGGQGFPGFRGGFRPLMEQRLGAHVESPNAILIDQLDLPEKQGMVLREVQKGSAADKAGLKTNDVLLELDGKPVPSSLDTFSKLLRGIKADQKVAAVVVRKGKKVTVKDLALPEAQKAPGFPLPGGFATQFGFPSN